MNRRRELLISTYGGEVFEVVPGLRALPHDRFMIVLDKDMEDGGQLSSLLDRLHVKYGELRVESLDPMASAMTMDKAIREYKGKGWHVSIDITGGRKLLSDAAVLAALSTGTEICCFEVEARRFPMLAGLGVSEALPREMSEALHSFKWPLPLEWVKGLDARDPTGRLLQRMKEMDLVGFSGTEGNLALGLTERGRACLDWLLRMQGAVNVSSV